MVVPEPVEALHQLVEFLELAGADAADLGDRIDGTVIERADGFGDLGAMFGQADADGAAVDPRALVIDIAEIDQLLEIVGDVGTEIVAAAAQLACGQFGIADVEQQQGLDGIDVGAVGAVELVLDDIEKTAVEPLDQLKRFQIEIAKGFRTVVCNR